MGAEFSVASLRQRPPPPMFCTVGTCHGLLWLVCFMVVLYGCANIHTSSFCHTFVSYSHRSTHFSTVLVLSRVLLLSSRMHRPSTGGSGSPAVQLGRVCVQTPVGSVAPEEWERILWQDVTAWLLFRQQFLSPVETINTVGECVRPHWTGTVPADTRLLRTVDTGTHFHVSEWPFDSREQISESHPILLV